MTKTCEICGQTEEEIIPKKASGTSEEPTSEPDEPDSEVVESDPSSKDTYSDPEAVSNGAFGSVWLIAAIAAVVVAAGIVIIVMVVKGKKQ